MTKLITNKEMWLSADQLENGVWVGDWIDFDIDDKTNDNLEDLLGGIFDFMDYDKREQIHNDFAPCTELKFLIEYCKIDKDFEKDILNNEYSLYFYNE